MKKFLLILMMALGSFFVAHAQDDLPQGAGRKEKIKALYIAFITERLQLTPDEAQKFWPVHTQFMNEMDAVKKDMAPLEKEQARLNIKKKYQESFVKILGSQKSDLFFKTESEFKQKLINLIKKRPNGNGPRQKMGSRDQE